MRKDYIVMMEDDFNSALSPHYLISVITKRLPFNTNQEGINATVLEKRWKPLGLSGDILVFLILDEEKSSDDLVNPFMELPQLRQDLRKERT